MSALSESAASSAAVDSTQLNFAALSIKAKVDELKIAAPVVSKPLGLSVPLAPSQSLPSASAFLPSSIRAAPGLRVTVEGPDRKRHTFNDKGEELGNDPSTGVYEEVEIEDMDFDEETRVYSYPCPCGDRFTIKVDSLIDGDDIASCPSCSLLIRVIFDPEQFFEPEPDSDSD